MLITFVAESTPYYHGTLEYHYDTVKALFG